MNLNLAGSYLEDPKDPNHYMPVDPKYFYRYFNDSANSGYLFAPSYVSSPGNFSGSGLDMLLGQKKQVIHAKIHMLASEIYQRYKLKSESLYRIDLDQCNCRTLIYQMGDFYIDRRRIDLERKIIDLEQEKRRENALYFRDVSFLKKELRYSMIEQLEEQQKTDLFMNQPEELPCTV